MRKKIGLSILAFFILAFISSTLFRGYKFYMHDKKQEEKINNLQLSMQQLQNANDNEFANNCGAGYDYLAIGNSITIHPETDYWWEERGMASTTIDKDYFHLVTSSLKSIYGDVNSYAYNFVTWETLNTDRAETIKTIDRFLNKDIDLISIQLGENISDISTLNSDFNYLISYIKKVAPNAKIIIIGNFWKNDKIDDIKQSVCKAYNIDFVNLKDIQTKTDYKCGLKTIVYDGNGQKHIINHDGVAQHPNDKAMKYIAEQICYLLQ